MINRLNEDQLQVFNKVKATIEQVSTDATDGAELFRLFVSGCGGTFDTNC